jgi:hypothetical protein
VLDYEKVNGGRADRWFEESLEGIRCRIIGLTTVELAGLMPDTATGRLKKVETFLF